MKSSKAFSFNYRLIFSFCAILAMITTLPAWAGDSESWGTRPYKIEKPIYDKLIKKAEQEIRKAQHRKEQSRSQWVIILGDISGADYQKFEKWHNSKEGNRPPKLISDLAWAKEELDDARKSYLIYAEGTTSPDNPEFGAGVRDSRWPAHLKMLDTQLAYYDLQAWDEKSRMRAAERYSYSFYVQLFENAVTGMQYIMRKHSEKFIADLADCAARSAYQAVGGKLLDSYAGLSRPSWLTSYSGAKFGTGSITGSGGAVMSCLDDATRGAIVGATVSGIRFNFVSKVTKTWHVPDEIAEYWWSKMINPGDSAKSPWAPQYRSLYDRVTQGAVNAMMRSASSSNLAEHTKDLIKFNWNKQIVKRITSHAKSAGLNYLKSAKKQAIKDGLGTFIQKRINKNAAKTAREFGKMEIEKDNSLKWLKAIGYFAAAYTTSVKAIDLNSKKREFEAAATPIIDEYKRIFSCLKKQDMPTGPQSVILIYELTRKQDVIDFFARCDEKMSDQILNQGQEFSRELYRLLELARETHANAYPSCKAVLDAATTLVPQVDPENTISPSDLAARLAGFRESVTTIEANAHDGAAKGEEIVKIRAASEQTALQACQPTRYLSGAPGDESTAGNTRTAASRAQIYGTDSSRLFSEIEALAQNTEMLATLVVDEAPILASASRVSAPLSTSDLQSLIAEIQGNLATSQAAGEGMSKIVSDAQSKYDQQFATLAAVNDDTADRLLDDSMAWLTEIEQLAKELTDCQGQVQSALSSVPESNDQEAASIDFISREDIEALRAKAEIAIQALTQTLNLAQTDDKVVQGKADEASLCLTLARIRVVLGQAQSAGDKAIAACAAGNQMASKAAAQFSQLMSKIKTLTAEAKSRNDALLKLEALANKISGYRNDAKNEATRARRNQTTADRLAGDACRRLREIKSAQSASDIQAILVGIQNAVSSCKSLSRQVHKSATDADGAASACVAIETALSSMLPPSPLTPIDGLARQANGEIDALDAVAGAAESQIAVVEGARGQAKSLLATGQTIALRVENTDLSLKAVGEMGSIVNQIEGIYSKILACSGDTRALAGKLIARQAEMQSSEQALSNTIRQINNKLRYGSFSEKAAEITKAAGTFAEIAGWSAEGMGEILITVASCQAAAEKALAQANAAEASCAQHTRMKAIPNPSGGGWACTCINPQDDYNEQLGGCVNDKCREYESEFFGALMNNQINAASRVLKKARHCGFAVQGPANIRKAECNNNAGEFLAHAKAGRLKSADRVLRASRDCGFAEQGASLLNTANQYQPGNDRRPQPTAPSRPPPSNNTSRSGGSNNAGSGGNSNGCPPGSILNGALLGVCVPAAN